MAPACAVPLISVPSCSPSTTFKTTAQECGEGGIAWEGGRTGYAKAPQNPLHAIQPPVSKVSFDAHPKALWRRMRRHCSTCWRPSPACVHIVDAADAPPLLDVPASHCTHAPSHVRPPPPQPNPTQPVQSPPPPHIHTHTLTLCPYTTPRTASPALDFNQQRSSKSAQLRSEQGL